ncbi:MAG: thioredoxin-like domain-containing protein [Planctomycetota bacterium]
MPLTARIVLPAFCLSACLAASASPALAQSQVTPEVIFGYRPVSPGVAIDTPPAEQWSACRVDVSSEGFVLIGPAGQVLRRFTDTNGSGQVDSWGFFRQGMEVYRDIDTDGDRIADQHRWLNTGGSRWALDPDQDGRPDSWKRLSAHEAARVAVEAMIAGDVRTLGTVLVSAEDLRSLGVSEDVAVGISGGLKDVAGQTARLRSSSSLLADGVKWLRFDGTAPGLVPAGSGPADRDLLVHANAMAIVERAGKPGLIQIGELVQIGDVWKLTTLPQPVEGDELRIAAGGFLMRPETSVPAGVIPPGGISPEMQKLLRRLQKIDAGAPGPEAGMEAFARYNTARAEVLGMLVEAAADQPEKEQWLAQLADSLAAAAQSGNFPQGLEQLDRAERLAKSIDPDSPIVAYVNYRKLLSEYAARLRDGGGPEVQAWWLERLESFADAFPKAEDSAEALLQLAIAREFAGEIASANAFYKRLADSFPRTIPGRRASGAVRRLAMKGKRLDFAGDALAGGKLSTADFGGKIVLIDFWSTWCKPCAEDLPRLREIYRKYNAAGFEIVGVAADATADQVRQHLAANDMPWPHVFEPGGLDGRPSLELGIVSLPTMVLLDETGTVISRNVSLDDLERVLADKLGG